MHSVIMMMVSRCFLQPSTCKTLPPYLKVDNCSLQRVYKAQELENVDMLMFIPNIVNDLQLIEV